MIRLVLDTNVFVGGVFTPQTPPAQILSLISRGHLRLITSKPIIKEAKKVLRYPKITKILEKQGISQKEVKNALNNLIKLAIITPGEVKIKIIEADPSDNIFLSAAIEGRADFIVSGDHHLTDLKSFKGIPILTPTGFLKRSKSEDKPDRNLREGNILGPFDTAEEAIKALKETKLDEK